MPSSQCHVEIIRLELFCTFLVSHAFARRVLICFVSDVVIFDRGEQTNPFCEGCPKKFAKVIWKILLMEDCISKAADL